MVFLNVRPTLASANAPYERLTDPILFSQLVLKHSSSRLDGENICLGQFGLTICRAFKFCLTILGIPIGHVFGLRAKKKMIRIYAGWIIAAMANMHPFRDLATVDFK
jgi:hypothetical protein